MLSAPQAIESHWYSEMRCSKVSSSRRMEPFHSKPNLDHVMFEQRGFDMEVATDPIHTEVQLCDANISTRPAVCSSIDVSALALIIK